jgi:hypothetical protein
MPGSKTIDAKPAEIWFPHSSCDAILRPCGPDFAALSQNE